MRLKARPAMRSWELLDCGRRLRENGDPRAGFISINDGGATLMTVRSLGTVFSPPPSPIQECKAISNHCLSRKADKRTYEGCTLNQ